MFTLRLKIFLLSLKHEFQMDFFFKCEYHLEEMRKSINLFSNLQVSNDLERFEVPVAKFSILIFFFLNSLICLMQKFHSIHLDK